MRIRKIKNEVTICADAGYRRILPVYSTSSRSYSQRTNGNCTTVHLFKIKIIPDYMRKPRLDGCSTNLKAMIASLRFLGGPTNLARLSRPERRLLTSSAAAALNTKTTPTTRRNTCAGCHTTAAQHVDTYPASHSSNTSATATMPLPAPPIPKPSTQPFPVPIPHTDHPRILEHPAAPLETQTTRSR